MRLHEITRKREYPLAPRDEWYSNCDYASRGGRTVQMSPNEFLRQVRPLKIDDISRDNIDSLKRYILDGGTLDPLAIYADGQEDGRHRAHAAKELGITLVPVLDFHERLWKNTTLSWKVAMGCLVEFGKIQIH